MVDSSFCPDLNVGGYGHWIISNRGHRSGGGRFQKAPRSPHKAEMMGIVNSLYEAGRRGLARAGDNVLIQCDCIAAMDRLGGKHPITGKFEANIVKKFNHAVDKLSINVRFRHVKGHINSLAPRHRSNNTCDRIAKSYMKQARQLKRCHELKRLHLRTDK